MLHFEDEPKKEQYNSVLKGSFSLCSYSLGILTNHVFALWEKCYDWSPQLMKNGARTESSNADCGSNTREPRHSRNILVWLLMSGFSPLVLQTQSVQSLLLLLELLGWRRKRKEPEIRRRNHQRPPFQLSSCPGLPVRTLVVIQRCRVETPGPNVSVKPKSYRSLCCRRVKLGRLGTC